MTENQGYLAPRTLEEAARALARPEATALAGGTDLLPRWSKGLSHNQEAHNQEEPRACARATHQTPGSETPARGLPRCNTTLVDLKRVEGLRGVTRADGEVRVGACTALSEIAADPIIRDAAPVLTEAAGRVACPQIRNRATIGGNLCNASPAADTAVPLILLDATLELASGGPGGMKFRTVPITGFFQGPGRTVLDRGEILSCIRFKPPFGGERPRGLTSAARRGEEAPRGLTSAARDGLFTAWDKLGTRPAMEIAVASVGVALRIVGGKVVHARVGYGSVAPVPLRGRQAERQLDGQLLVPDVIEAAVAAATKEIAPISDVRAGEAYRREVVGVMLRRMLQRAECG